MSEPQNSSNSAVTSGKTGYHLMVFMDGKNGQIHQMGIGQGIVNFLLILVLILIIVPFVGWKKTNDKVIALQDKLSAATTQYEESAAKVTELESQNSELAKKVTVLSDTVNAKVEQENKKEQETTISHMPSGFPLSSSASMEKSEEEGSKQLIFTAAEGSSVIAAGEGTVAEITTDTTYSNRLVIDHENGYKSIYYNNGSPMVKEGDWVIPSSVLFVIGDKNQKVGYEILLDDQAIDPMEVIKIDG